MLETYDGFARKDDPQFKDLENERTTNVGHHAGSHQLVRK